MSGLICIYAFTLYYARPHVVGDGLDLTTFENAVEKGQVRTATLLDSDNYVVGEYVRSDGRPAQYNSPYLKEGLSDLVKLLAGSRVETGVDQQGLKKTLLLASYLLPGLIFLPIMFYLVVSFRRGSGLFRVRSGAHRSSRGELRVTFSDVAGQASAIAELRQIGEFLADIQGAARLGASIPKGILIYGPPGCGKTLLARAFAGELGAAFYSISGPDFVEMYVGVGAARVRDLFGEASRNAPAVIFIDELDAVGGRRRGAGGGSQPEQEQALHQILVEMDGFSTAEGVVVLAATNRPDVLDPALLRPGRFDRGIGLERPDEPTRLEILRLHARGKPLEPDADLAAIARRAVGLSGADLASVMNEAALQAVREHRSQIGAGDLGTALERILEAPERQRRLSLRDRSFGRRSQGDGERITFADVAGQAAAVTELREIEQYLTEPERFAALGARIPRGILLYGPPGAGKTLLARALANEANATFFAVTGTEFVEVFVGEGAARVRDLFAEARTAAPAIIFLDELDAIGGHRGGRSAGTAGRTQEHDQTLNQILTEMDGFSSSTGVLVIGSTNRPDVLDPALLRPGRFDRSIGLERPDERGRLEILNLHAQHRVMAPGADLGRVARRAIGLNGADLAGVVNEAALLAARAGRPAVTQDELEEALDRTLSAPDRQRRLSMRDRSFGRRFTAPEERFTFADVAGADDAISELAEFRDYLAEPQRFEAMGARIPRGVLLVGPPGCGKTLLAKAVAGETNAAFFSVAAPEFVEVFVGEGAGRVRDLFAEARSVAPAIIFIDEIDAIGGHRGMVSYSGEREQTLNQILVELDGFSARAEVIVMAATNRPDRLDPALVRPGRFDRQVTVQQPDHRGRRDILALLSRDKRLAADVDLGAIAGLARGCSGADLANMVNEAALLATRRGLAELTMAVIEEALERSVMGVGSRANQMTEEERRSTAYHEAGHALVTRALPGAGTVHKLSIATGGHALGVTWHRDDVDRLLYSRSRMIHIMACALGGRAAEDLVMREPTSGSSSDLQKATTMARRMVRELGMSRGLGPLRYADEWLPDGRVRPYSEEMAARIDGEVALLVDEAYRLAGEVLAEARPQLDAVAGALVARETLTGAELEELIAAGAGAARPNGQTVDLGHPEPEPPLGRPDHPSAGVSTSRGRPDR